MRPKAIIFDCFGVIVTESGKMWFEKHAPGEASDQLRLEYCRKEDAGEISAEEFFGLLATLNATSAAAVQKEWEETALPNADVVAYIRELKETYKTALCTNAASAFLRGLLARHELSPLFYDIIVSSEVRLIKPGPEIFTLTLSRLGVGASEAIFIDDNPANVAAAEALGIRSLVYRDLPSLKRDMALLLAS